MATREDMKAVFAERMKRVNELSKGKTPAISDDFNSRLKKMEDEERLRVAVHIDISEMYSSFQKYLLNRFDSPIQLSPLDRFSGCTYATLSKNEIIDIASQVPYVISIGFP